MVRKNGFLVMAAVVFMVGHVADAKAALSLSVTPVSGGNSLRFGRAPSTGQISKEVRVRVTSTDGSQYQVFHRLLDSLLNEKNVSLGTDVMSTYTLVGSNGSGTLYAQGVERTGFADQLLYSSGPGGESDSFTVAYIIDGERIRASGNFFGRIQYRLRSTGGSGQDEVILNVTVETSGALKIDVEGSSTADSLRLTRKGNRGREGFVRLAFRENLGQRIQVFQEVDPFPQDELFMEIGGNVVMFAASGGKGEPVPHSPAVLTRKRVLVYSSQENEDVFLVHFTLDEGAVQQQKAGLYKGQLKYIVRTDQDERVFPVRLEVEVDPVFTVEVDLPPQGLSFQRLLPGSPAVVREVEVRVITNLGRPYMVMQYIASPLTNEKGNEMPDEYFTSAGELMAGQTGRVVYTDYTPVRARGDDAVFFSDNKGSASRFKIRYRLKSSAAMVPGDYTTSLRFSLGEV